MMWRIWESHERTIVDLKKSQYFLNIYFIKYFMRYGAIILKYHL